MIDDSKKRRRKREKRRRKWKKREESEIAASDMLFSGGVSHVHYCQVEVMCALGDSMALES